MIKNFSDVFGFLGVARLAASIIIRRHLPEFVRKIYIKESEKYLNYHVLAEIRVRNETVSFSFNYFFFSGVP